MTNSRTKNASLNLIFAILLQAVTFIRGLILPRIIVPVYGSDVNGLISSITQFLAYISLLDAGVGGVFRASLYKPLANDDLDGISGIVNEQKRFYRKIGITFIFYVAALCFVYPLIARTEAGKPYIVSLILILSVSTFAEYFFSLPYVSLLSADQKIRINYIVNIVYNIVHVLVALFWIAMKADIRMIYLSMCIIGLLRPLFYTLYVKKHYALNSQAKCNKEVLKQRWNGVIHNLAVYIHLNTDVVVLTLFASTAMVSVYNIYNAIICGIFGVVMSVSNSVAAGLGNLLITGEDERIKRTVDIYELVQSGLTTVLYTITALMLIPFVRIYTVQMTDMNYIQPQFGYILIISGAIYCFRSIYSTISLSANKFKETQLGALVECVVNLTLSLVLVIVAKAGLTGVAIGTAAGMLVRYVFEVVFLSKNVLQRPAIKAVKILLTSIGIAVVSTLICRFLIPYDTIESVLQWILFAFASAGVTVAVAIAGYTALHYKTVKLLLGNIKIFKRKKRA